MTRQQAEMICEARRAQVEDLWKDFDRFPREEWVEVVQAGDTQRGYWDWVLAQIEQMEPGPDESPDTIEIELEDGTAMRWEIPHGKTEELLAAVKAIIGAPDTTKL